MLAGPSEVLVIADDTSDASTIAADLLAQVHPHWQIKKHKTGCTHTSILPTILGKVLRVM